MMRHPVQKFILSQVADHPEDVVALAAKRFRVSRPAVHRHLNTLISQGLVGKVGTKRTTRYFLERRQGTAWTIPVTPELKEDVVWKTRLESRLKGLSLNVFDILYYGFTEMLNNVIDHAAAKSATVRLKISAERIKIEIADDGVGVFGKIKGAWRFSEERESVLALCKGKITTAPEKHSGEGIFFTSRIFDEFCLESDGIRYTRVNAQEPDWNVVSVERRRGTVVTLVIAAKSNKRLRDVFDAHTDPETRRFDRTHVFVELAKLGEERYISRSQAKRILDGLDKFGRITLDFLKVVTVGQAFVDEVFRVFQNSHPEIRIESVNANADVDFMLRRGLASSPLTLSNV